MSCSVETCGRSDRMVRGLCSLHYKRMLRHGTPHKVVPAGAPPGERHGRWTGKAVGYHGAHQRVKRARGSASNFPCAECGERASDWAYSHSCPNERLASDRGRERLICPCERGLHYIPLCRSCHRRLDRLKREEGVSQPEAGGLGELNSLEGHEGNVQGGSRGV